MIAAIIFLLFFLLIGGIGIVGSIFWIWMLVNAAQNKALSENERLTWVLIIVFTHFIGALIYFFAARKPRQVFYQQQYNIPPFQQQGYPPQPNYLPQQGYPPQQAYPYQQPAQQPSWNQQYQQGYQGYQAPSGNAYPEQKGDPLPSPERYEYPRASYPEQSQE